ncbi:MAG TPA: gamma-glutamyl-gamma-aminobutyrate hydrolase family protein [Acidimicrobiia bacterium]|jgi:putative glutamine amidotransferase|nr:gamma-glutamyl-gamma-aminobutyrate hydrolase family protein [Acidimicrobiia bacterium]
MRPLIAVTGVPIVAGGVLGWRQGAVACAAAYVDAVSRAGGDPVIMPPVLLDDESASARLSRFDGLLLTGGGDIDPTLYGQETRPEVSHVNPARDEFEIPLVRAAIDRGLPTLCICRGVQVLNVALGGTLHQHISDREELVAHRNEDGTDGVLHEIRAQPGSRVMKAMGVERARTFSYHHQALADLGPGLVAVAWAEDGLLEGVELDDGWVLGVQWHAEATAAADPTQQAVFDALVREAAGA